MGYALTDGVKRTLVMTMDANQTSELMRIAAPVLGGAVGVKLLDWFFSWRSKKQREPVEFQARIVEEGSDFRRDLIAAVERKDAQLEEQRKNSSQQMEALREKFSLMLDRAHRAEMDANSLSHENKLMRSRLARRDEQVLVLIKQLQGLGVVPVVAPMGDDYNEPAPTIPIKP